MWTVRIPTTCLTMKLTFTVGKKQLGPHYRPHAFKKHGFAVAAEVLDKVKAAGL